MPSTGSVTQWLDQLQTGDPAAAEKLWDSYFRRLVGLARAKLQGAAKSQSDIAQDLAIALSARDQPSGRYRRRCGPLLGGECASADLFSHSGRIRLPVGGGARLFLA